VDWAYSTTWANKNGATPHFSKYLENYQRYSHDFWNTRPVYTEYVYPHQVKYNYNSHRGAIWRILTTSVKAGLYKYSRSVVQIKMLIDLKFKAIVNLTNTFDVSTITLYYTLKAKPPFADTSVKERL